MEIYHIEEIESNIDEIEVVEKFNPYHDSRGRFATSGSAASFTYSPGKSKAHDKAIAREKVKDNPYRHLPADQLESRLGRTASDIRRAKLEASLTPSSATNKKIAAAKKRLKKLQSEEAQMEQALEYVKQYGDKNTPF